MKTGVDPVSPIWSRAMEITLSEIRDIEIDTYRVVEISGVVGNAQGLYNRVFYSGIPSMEI